MRFRHPDGTVVHLAYGTNVHPAEDVEGIAHQLRTYGAGVRAALGTDRVGLGLWLPAAAASELAADEAATDELRGVLDHHGLDVVTLNAFPYERFHAPVVKHNVYRPDWSEPARLSYTLACARVLARLLPDDAVRGSISTLPLGWGSSWRADHQRIARAQLDQLADELAKLRADTGRTIQVGLEPEPGCVVETTADVVERLDGMPAEHLGVCLDTCHLATGFEDVPETVVALAGAGIEVVKTQVSAALHVEEPSDAVTQQALAAFAEDRFLHQVRQQSAGQPLGVVGRDDLPDAQDGARGLSRTAPWRVHFHIPVHAAPARPLDSTSDELVTALGALVGGRTPVTDHLEVETYTWSVLPPDRRPADDRELVAGLAGELSWVRDRLTELGLEAL